MGPSIAWPALFTIAVGLAASRLHRQLRPSLAAGAYAALAAVGAVGVASTIVLFASLVVARLPVLSDRLSWCTSLAGDHQLPFWVATAVVAGLVAMVLSTGRAARHIVRTNRFAGPDEELVVLPSDEPTAYAVPGRPGRGGHIVVSAGMLRCLDSDERRVLLAHERAHLARGHHRYVWVADLAAAAVPVLDPLRRRVRFAVERWADEDAARAVGDRDLVARAICRAALAQHDAAAVPALAMSGDAVGERVAAMLRPPRTGRAPSAALGAVGLALALGVASSSLQLHHVAILAEHVCGLR